MWGTQQILRFSTPTSATAAVAGDPGSLRMTASFDYRFRRVLVSERGVFLIAFGGEADVIELDFIDSGLGDEFGEGDVVVLHLGVGGIGPDELAVFAPGLPGIARFYGQFRMARDQVLIAKDGDAGDSVHV